MRPRAVRRCASVSSTSLVRASCVGLAVLVVCAGMLAVGVTSARVSRVQPPASPSVPSAWRVTFADVAERAGLRDPVVYGGIDRKRFIIETNGSGVALVDYDNDGWLDALTLSGTRLSEGTREEVQYAPGSRANQPSVPEHAERDLRGRDRCRRPSADRVGLERVRR